MNTLYHFNLILFFIAIIENYSLSQMPIMINETKLFTKVKIKLTSDVAYITACSDAKLIKNCKSYFASGAGDYQETTLTSTEVNSIAKFKNLSGLKNVNTEKVNKKVSLSYIDKSNARVYFFGHGKNLNIVEFTTHQGTISKRPASSPEKLKCLQSCKDAQNACWTTCFIAQDYACLDGCYISYLGCNGICDKDKYIKKVQIALNNILVKPISLQN